MPPGQTCSPCRGRKVRCDGIQPMCGPCSKARKPIDCTYTSATTVPTAPKGEYLKKGAACAPCRRKKKKCDAKRPFCTTCKVADKEKECTYDENVERTLTEALFLRTHFLEQRLAAYETTVASLSQPVSPNGLPVVPADMAVASSSMDPRAGPQATYQVPMYNFPEALNVLFDHMAAPAPTTDVYSLSTPQMPDLEGLQDFRQAWSEHSRQYGCILSPEKMQAILAGDTSGAIVHPAFTYIAQLLGCHMWQLQRRMMMFDAVEARQEILLVHALQHIDPISEIQVRYQFACFLLLRQRMEEGEQQLVIAAHVVQRHCLNFPIPPQIMHTHDISQTEAELITGLAHFMYLDRCSSFVFRVPMRLDKSFDQTFDTVTSYYPLFAKTNIVYLRTRSLLLLLRVHDFKTDWCTITASAHNGIFSASRTELIKHYWPLLENLTTHGANLENEMLKATFYEERELSVALKFCMVVTLSAKAEMHWLLHRSHEESAQRALDVVMEVVTLTRTIKDNEFLLLDPLLGVCWSMVARIVVEVIKDPPLTAGVQWNTALETIDISAKKLGYDMPFMEESVQAISDVKRFVEVP